MRKHRRLLSVIPRPATFSVTGWGVKFGTVAGFITGNDKTPIGFINKAAFTATNKPKMTFSAYIAIDEVSLGFKRPVDYALREFAGLAYSIIGKFDTP
jgi:hypothetical protein